MQHVLEGGAYFDKDTKSCDAYLRCGDYYRKYGISA